MTIEITTISDHAPVIMRMKDISTQESKKMWRLNEDLLQDEEIEKNIKKELEKYFIQNESPEVSEATIWESHKAYIRGILISVGSKKKKDRIKKNI